MNPRGARGRRPGDVAWNSGECPPGRADQELSSYAEVT